MDGTISGDDVDSQRVEGVWLATEDQYMRCGQCGRTETDTESQRTLLQSTRAKGSVKEKSKAMGERMGAKCRSVTGD